MRAVPGRAGDARSGRQLLVCVPQLMHQLLPAIISMCSTGRCSQQRIHGAVDSTFLIMDLEFTLSGLWLGACLKTLEQGGLARAAHLILPSSYACKL